MSLSQNKMLHQLLQSGRALVVPADEKAANAVQRFLDLPQMNNNNYNSPTGHLMIKMELHYEFFRCVCKELKAEENHRGDFIIPSASLSCTTTAPYRLLPYNKAMEIAKLFSGFEFTQSDESSIIAKFKYLKREIQRLVNLKKVRVVASISDQSSDFSLAEYQAHRAKFDVAFKDKENPPVKLNTQTYTRQLTSQVATDIIKCPSADMLILGPEEGKNPGDCFMVSESSLKKTSRERFVKRLPWAFPRLIFFIDELLSNGQSLNLYHQIYFKLYHLLNSLGEQFSLDKEKMTLSWRNLNLPGMKAQAIITHDMLDAMIKKIQLDLTKNNGTIATLTDEALTAYLVDTVQPKKTAPENKKKKTEKKPTQSKDQQKPSPVAKKPTVLSPESETLLTDCLSNIGTPIKTGWKLQKRFFKLIAKDNKEFSLLPEQFELDQSSLEAIKASIQADPSTYEEDESKIKKLIWNQAVKANKAVLEEKQKEEEKIRKEKAKEIAGQRQQTSLPKKMPDIASLSQSQSSSACPQPSTMASTAGSAASSSSAQSESMSSLTNSKSSGSDGSLDHSKTSPASTSSGTLSQLMDSSNSNKPSGASTASTTTSPEAKITSPNAPPKPTPISVFFDPRNQWHFDPHAVVPMPQTRDQAPLTQDAGITAGSPYTPRQSPLVRRQSWGDAVFSSPSTPASPEGGEESLLSNDLLAILNGATSPRQR